MKWYKVSGFNPIYDDILPIVIIYFGIKYCEAIKEKNIIRKKYPYLSVKIEVL